MPRRHEFLNDDSRKADCFWPLTGYTHSRKIVSRRLVFPFFQGARMFFSEKIFLCAALLSFFPLNALWADQEQSQYFLDKGNIYKNEKKMETAIEYYKESIEQNPYNAEAHNNLGELYARKNMIDDALVQFDKALELQPGYVAALSNESFAYLQKKVYPQAIFYAKKALMIDPGFGSAHYNLGMAYFFLGQYSDALPELKLAVRYFPDNADIYERLGDDYRAQNRMEEAIAYYHLAIRADPLDAGCRSKLGDIYLDEDEEKKALEQYEASEDLEPNNIESRYKMADHYESIRDWNSARREYLLILATDDQQARAHKQVALIYERDEQTGLALYHWDKYLKIVPDDPEAKQHIIDIRKPMLTKKQAEEMAKFDNKLVQAHAIPTPTLVPTAKSMKPSAPIVQGQDMGGTAPGASNPPAPPPAGTMPTPTPSTQLVPVELVAPTPTSEVGVLPK